MSHPDAPDSHGGDLVAAALAAAGVRALFTLCGGHISPILVAARSRGLAIVDTRHEASAVFAADAHARLTGVPGVAAVTAGPGVTNAVTAVENARLAQSPVVLLGGATATALRGRGALQDIDQRSIFSPRVKWAASARRVRDLAPLTARALAEAASGVPGPVFLEIPVDLLYPEATVRSWYGAKAKAAASLEARATAWYLRRHVDRLFADGRSPASAPASAIRPRAASDATIARAAALVRDARRPVLLVGSPAIEAATAERTAAAVLRLGVPTYLGGMARGLLGPAATLQHRHRRREALRESDLVVLAGVPFDFRLDYGRAIPARTRTIAIDREPARNRRPTLSVRADPADFLDRLSRAVATDPGEWHATLRARDDARDAEIADRPAPAAGIDPLALCRAVDEAASSDAIFVADGGDFVATAAYVLRPRAPLSWLDPGPFGTLGVGGGFALGAALARPGAEIWIVYGDGSAAYSLAEFDTFVRHGLAPIAVVGNDARWSQIARDQIAILHDDVACTLLPTAYHDVARGYGAAGFAVDSLADLGATLREARRLSAAGTPVLINARLAPSDFREGSLSI